MPDLCPVYSQVVCCENRKQILTTEIQVNRRISLELFLSSFSSDMNNTSLHSTEIHVNYQEMIDWHLNVQINFQ